jgi:glycosyltransferase involved in cell wall biosynthesis
MKVLVFTTVFPNAAQPALGTFVFERVRHLAEIADVRVVAPVAWRARLGATVPLHDTRGPLEILHPTFLYVPGIFKVLDGVLLFLSVFWTVRRLRREFAFDVIDAHFVFPDGFAAVLLGRWSKRPVVITERGTVTPLSEYRLRKRAMSWVFQRATRVIAVAHHLGERAIGLGADRRRTAIIPNAVDVEVFAPLTRAEARRRLGLRADIRLIVSVGRLIRTKGFDRVLRVLPDVRRMFPDVVFSIIGGNPVGEKGNGSELGRMVRELGLMDNVIFGGEQPRDVVVLWLSAADVFVLASDMEGCPNVVWEALACGRPVIATKVGEVGRMVPPFGGILFDDPEDATSLRDSLVRGLQMEWNSGAIRAHAAAHSWSDVAERVLEQWQMACENPTATEYAAGSKVTTPSSTSHPTPIAAISKGKEAE